MPNEIAIEIPLEIQITNIRSTKRLNLFYIDIFPLWKHIEIKTATVFFMTDAPALPRLGHCKLYQC